MCVFQRQNSPKTGMPGRKKSTAGSKKPKKEEK
jgi:hypothetical protein